MVEVKVVSPHVTEAPTLLGMLIVKRVGGRGASVI